MGLFSSFKAVANPFGTIKNLADGGGKSKNKGELQNLLGDMLNIQRESFPVQQRNIKAANAAAMGGYDSALNDVTRSEQAGAEDIAYQSQAARQAAQGAAAQRGLSGSSVGTNLGMASARDTRRSIADLQMNLARQRSGLRIAQGQQKAQGLTNLANFEAYKANSIVNTLQPYFQHQSAKLLQKQGAKGAQLGGFGQLAGMAIGGAFGGPAGAAAGGSFLGGMSSGTNHMGMGAQMSPANPNPYQWLRYQSPNS